MHFNVPKLISEMLCRGTGQRALKDTRHMCVAKGVNRELSIGGMLGALFVPAKLSR